VPNPLAATQAFLDQDTGLPFGTTHSTAYPTGQINHPHVQYAWDGTPSDADNRENTTIRVTVWTAKGKVTDAQDIAGDLRARFLLWSSATVWRVDRGAGRLPGTDRDNELPFCSFTVQLVMRAAA
jgi:hypothetical protein